MMFRRWSWLRTWGGAAAERRLWVLGIGVWLACGALGVPAGQAAPAEVTVPATEPAVGTGLFVRAGDTLTITATGRWTMWKGTYQPVGPEGHSFQASPLGGWGRLCARVGSGPEVVVPIGTPWKVDRSGALFLLALCGNYGRDKAEGALTVRIEGGMPLTTYLADARARGVEVMVPANAACVDTGVYLEAGEAFTIDAVGSWTMATDRGNHPTDAEGVSRVRFRGMPLGQLLCRVSGLPGPVQTPLGTHSEMRAPASGILYLAPNHLWWMGPRNTGTLRVVVQGGRRASDTLRAKQKTTDLNAARERILERCNALRAQMGLPAVTRIAALESAAQGHAEYLDRNEGRGHVQEEGKPGFTGKSVGDRLQAAGQRGGGGEVVAYEETAEEAFDIWVASVYHRQFATHPALTGIGLGLCGRAQVINYAVAPTPRTQTVACCPASRQQDVPLSWHGLESPDPIPPGGTRPVGYTVSAHFPEAVRSVSDATLRGPDNAPVACYTLHRLNDTHLKSSDSVFLLPRAPLEPGATYRAAMTVETAAGERRVAWAFTTKAVQERALAPEGPVAPVRPIE